MERLVPGVPVEGNATGDFRESVSVAIAIVIRRKTLDPTFSSRVLRVTSKIS